MKKITFLVFSLIICMLVPELSARALKKKAKDKTTESKRRTPGPYMATGIKIGEVDQTSAIIWVRLTESNQRVPETAPTIEVLYIDPETGEAKPREGGRPNKTPVVVYPEGYTVKNIAGAVPGAPGKVRLEYKAVGDRYWNSINWTPVKPEQDFTRKIKLSTLRPGKKYEIRVEAAAPDSDKVGSFIEASFKTAPSEKKAETVNFIVTTGTSYPDIDSKDGYKFYNSALKLDPEFFVHTGDILYYDHFAKNIELAHWCWDRMYSLPNHINFHKQVSSYFIKDDHETWMDDANPGLKTKFMGDLKYEDGFRIFRYEVPMGKKTYRTKRWGKDLQIWMVEGRDYRTSNYIPDGPEKTIWGKKQMKWFQQSLATSDATFKILISPTPIVGPDRPNKKDNHANNSFAYEGSIIRQFVASMKNTYIVCGDRHWQYISADAKTGAMEFSCGPGSHKHAGGWPKDDKRPEHIYLNVVGGFMEGEVSRSSGAPQLTFRHYDPDGKLLNEHVLKSE